MWVPDSNDSREGVPETDDLEIVEEPIACWRCGGIYGAQFARCPACEAPRRRRFATSAHGRRTNPVTRRMYHLLIFYGLLLVPMLVFAAALYVRQNLPAAEEMLGFIAILGTFQVILILAALLSIRPPVPTVPRHGMRLITWVASFPLLAGFLALNISFFWILTEYLGIPDAEDNLLQVDHLFLWVVLIIAVQPAIFEEIFFRHTALWTLRETMSERATVWTSAVMFGVAHIGNPLAIPYLVLFGAFLAHVRIRSGSLLLPMILHFLHNLFVVLFERLA